MGIKPIAKHLEVIFGVAGVERPIKGVKGRLIGPLLSICQHYRRQQNEESESKVHITDYETLLHAHNGYVAFKFDTIDFSSISVVDAYSILSNTVVPRPIAFVSTVSPSGIENLAPFSFFVVGGANPASLVFSPVLKRDGSEKDTLRNIRFNGEYVINVVVMPMAAGMNETSAPMPYEESEWERSGFSKLDSTMIKPARVAESPVQFECRLHTIVEHGSGASAARYVIGEVLVAHIRDDVGGDVGVDPTLLLPISRMGGKDYVDLATVETFALERPDQ